MLITCTCGCKITMSLKVKLDNKPGCPVVPLKCPNCNKEIMLITVDMDTQTPIIKNKETNKIELSFKED